MKIEDIIDNLIQCGINILPINLGSLKRTLNVNENKPYYKFINSSYHTLVMKYIIFIRIQCIKVIFITENILICFINIKNFNVYY